jgi:hypothetical protein
MLANNRYSDEVSMHVIAIKGHIRRSIDAFVEISQGDSSNTIK